MGTTSTDVDIEIKIKIVKLNISKRVYYENVILFNINDYYIINRK